MPNLRAMGRGGFLVTGRSMMPSVTNVNNVSIVTAKYPSEHGICSNYKWDRQTGEELYVESAKYIRSQSMFRRAEELGMTSLVVTSKDKLRTLVGVDATTSISSRAAAGLGRGRGRAGTGHILARGERLGDRRGQAHHEAQARRYRLSHDHRTMRCT